MLMLSTPSYSEWSKVAESTGSRNVIYVDFNKIKKADGYVYYYALTDYAKPVFGDLSVTVYTQGDCKLSREKGLTWIFHQGKKGQGRSLIENTPDSKWSYPSAHASSSSKEIVLRAVCAKAE